MVVKEFVGQIVDDIRELLSEEELHEFEDVDLDYLRSNRVQYNYIEIKEECVRCNLCGRQMAIDNLFAMIEHVAEHDGKGTSSVDPLAPPPLNKVEGESIDRSSPYVEDYKDKKGDSILDRDH